MKVLVVGGSGFLSSAIVHELLVHGHEVSTIQRSSTNREGVDEILVDLMEINEIENKLKEKTFDSIIDVGPIVKSGITKKIANLLKTKATSHYTFISSIGVYKDFSKSVDESSEIHDAITDDSIALSGATFGGLKVACENAILSELGEEKTLIVRPGLIIGPNDKSGRFAYWVKRFLRDDDNPVVAPESENYKTQAIDVRDLAAWIVLMMENKKTGIYNSVMSYSFGEILSACQNISKKPKQIVFVPNSVLVEKGIKPFSQFPLWVPESMIGLSTADCSKALSNGLSARPICETVEDTKNWLIDIGDELFIKNIQEFYKVIGNIEIDWTI